MSKQYNFNIGEVRRLRDKSVFCPVSKSGRSDVTMVSRSSVVLALALCACAAATNVEQCPGRSIEGLSEDVQLNPCKKLPCKLKKGTQQHITIKFTPKTDLPKLKNHVTGTVFGVPVPFLGVDGNSICDKVHTESGEQASCPLKAGVTYIYKDSFPILSIYPSITLKVHWALQNDDKDIVCFEVPARIA